MASHSLNTIMVSHSLNTRMQARAMSLARKALIRAEKSSFRFVLRRKAWLQVKSPRQTPRITTKGLLHAAKHGVLRRKAAAIKQPTTQPPPSRKRSRSPEEHCPEPRRSKRLKGEPAQVSQVATATPSPSPSAATPEPSSAATPEPSSAATPEPSSAAAPDSSSAAVHDSSLKATHATDDKASRDVSPGTSLDDDVRERLCSWGDDLKDLRTRGLKNPGQWCYRRATMQVLAATAALYNMLAESTACGADDCVACTLFDALDTYHSPDPCEYDDFDKAMNCDGILDDECKAVGVAADAGEFVLAIFNAMQARPCQDPERLRHLFQHSVQRRWRCEHCGGPSVRIDPLEWQVLLRLPVLPAEEQLTLEMCFNNTMESEQLEVRCDGCGSDGHRTRAVRFWDLPEVLIVRLSVFYMNWETSRTEKDHRRVQIPDGLDLAPHCHQGAQRTRYTTLGVVYHSGTLRGGHYIARVRNGGGIVELNDNSPPQRRQGWMSSLGNFSPYLVLMTRDK